MPQMKEVRRRNRRATEHRRAVLESIITHPTTPLMAGIITDCRSADYSAHMIESMVWQLVHEGLVEWREDGGGYFVTRAGLEYYEQASFDQAIPRPHERPRARRPRRKNHA